MTLSNYQAVYSTTSITYPQHFAGVTFMFGVSGVASAQPQPLPTNEELYSPFSKPFWGLLRFYLRGGVEVPGNGWSQPDFVPHNILASESTNFISRSHNYGGDASNTLYEITPAGSNYLHLVLNTFKDTDVPPEQVKLLLSLTFWNTRCGDYLNSVKQGFDFLGLFNYSMNTLTTRGQNLVLNTLKNIASAISEGEINSPITQKLCEAIISLSPADEWGILIASAKPRVSEYLANLVQSKFSQVNSEIKPNLVAAIGDC